MKNSKFFSLLFSVVFVGGFAQAKTISFPTTTTLDFKEGTVSIDLPESWKVSKERQDFPHLAQVGFYKDPESFSKIDISLFRLRGKDPAKTARSISSLEKKTGAGTGFIELKADKELSKRVHMVHLVHTPKLPGGFSKKSERVRIVYWNKDWPFVLSCKVKAEEKDVEDLPALIKGCSDLKVKLRTGK
ncbi:MAG: hypothetical protein VYA34_14605 [Myxococcota bacterium]|nr:hypothetical protein [Myxococcota bacterium]